MRIYHQFNKPLARKKSNRSWWWRCKPQPFPASIWKCSEKRKKPFIHLLWLWLVSKKSQSMQMTSNLKNIHSFIFLLTYSYASLTVTASWGGWYLIQFNNIYHLYLEMSCRTDRTLSMYPVTIELLLLQELNWLDVR